MKYLYFPHKDKAIPLIIELLLKERITINKEDIKIWSQPMMYLTSLLNDLNKAKKTNKKVIVYTNVVPSKDIFCKEYNIKIIDINDLILYCEKHKDCELYNIFD
jgi:hypothetical protein